MSRLFRVLGQSEKRKPGSTCRISPNQGQYRFTSTVPCTGLSCGIYGYMEIMLTVTVVPFVPAI